MYIKSYKIRLYPTKEQEQKMLSHDGACRFIWNYMLDHQQELYKNGEKYLSGFSMINLLKPLKNDGLHNWLYDVSNKSLSYICIDLDKAYQNFFNKKSGFPKFKSRKLNRPKFPIRENIWFSDGVVAIEKIGKVRYNTDFELPFGKGHKFTNPRISKSGGKWMLSFGMMCESQALQLTDVSMGIDLGLKDLAVAEFNEEQIVFHNINKSRKIRKLNRKIIRTQRSISRKYNRNKVGNKFVKTNNIMKEEDKLRKLYAHVSNIRMNYIHQTTHFLVSKLPRRVIMEDRDIVDMMKNKHLSKAIKEQCFHEFIRQMRYKCEWRGIEFVQANRFYPSSKTCSCCGNIKRDLKLKDRVYKCDVCGLVIDRDYNAAINLSRYTV